VRQLLPIVSSLVFVAPAFGQTVDAEGAASLTDDLSRYIGQSAIANRVVTVTVEGNSYRIALDFKALSGLLSPPDAGSTFDIPPFSVLARPLAGGNWDVTSSELPGGSLEFDGPDGHQSLQWSIAEGMFKGVYDPALAGFLTMSGSQSGMTLTSREVKQEAHASIGAGTFAYTGAASAGGGLDFNLSQSLADFVETVQIPDKASGQNFPVTIKAASLSVSASGQGYRTRALLDLLAFGVANSDEARLKANQAELKDRLLAVLPVWNRAEGAYRFNDFSAATPVGSFGAKTFGVEIGMDGAVPNGTLTYRLGLQGLTVPEQIVPAWSRPLLPTEMDLNFGGVGFNMDSIARKLIDGFDLNRQPPMPEEVTAEIGSEFMANPPKLVISRSTVKNRDTEITTEGEVTFVGGEPEANVTVEAVGYDKLVETVQAAAMDQPDIGQYLAVALAAKGFARTLPDGRIQWQVETKADGSVSVNGARLKGPDPQ
jgi:hypothetical protein